MIPRVPVLLYHGIEAQDPVLGISQALFGAQMRWLREHRVRVISLADCVQRLHEGKPLPERAVAITFDDGFESVYTAAFPVLMQHGFPATVFVVSAYCGRLNDWPGQPASVALKPLASWSQIAEMDRHGIAVGAHSATHPKLDLLPSTKVEEEIRGSKAEIEDRLGHAVALFSYPYGRHNDAVRRAVEGAYAGAVSARPGLLTGSANPFAIERVDAYYVKNPMLFRALPTPAMGVYLGVRRPLRALASAALRRPWM